MMTMNNDAVINRIAHIVGVSRKEVLDTLKKFGSIPATRKELERKKK